MFEQALLDPIIRKIEAALLPVAIVDDTHLPQREGQRRASVLIPIVWRDDVWQIILTQRPMTLKSHPGQISFPGGQAEADEGALAAALRETQEEIGLEQEFINVFGRLPSFNAVSKFRVTPFVGIVNPSAVMTACPTEVEEIFEVPLMHFMTRDRHVERKIEYGGETHILYDMPWPSKDDNRRNVWGMTAMMMYRLYQRVYEHAA